MTEDRNAVSWSALRDVATWRSPSRVTEHRNVYRANNDVDLIHRLAVALRGG